MTTESPNIYIPQGVVSLAEMGQQQIRLLVQGYAGTGKTFSGSSFPNPTYINIDRGLGIFAGRADIHEVQMWNPQYWRKFGDNKKDAILKWMEVEAPKLTANQTLIFDGSTGFQNCWEQWIEANPVYTNQGKVDDFAPWRLKVALFGAICEQFKSLYCNVIYIAHETNDRDKKGDLNGKLRPLLTGQFVDQLPSHFTDYFRAKSTAKKDCSKLTNGDLKDWRMNVSEFAKMQDEFKDTDSIYYWQTAPDDLVDCKCSSLVNPPRYIPATYQYFQRYMKKA